MKDVLFRLLLSLVAVPAFAAGTVFVDPPGPLSTEPVTLRYEYGCVVQSESVARAGTVIKITVHTGSPCATAVVQRAVRIEPLPPGSYRVEVLNELDDSVHAVTLFTVRNGGPKIVEAHPFAIRANSRDRPRVRLVRTDGMPVCLAVDCSDVTIRVAGAVPVDVQRDGNAVWFTAPPRAVGLADIDLIKNSTTTLEKTVGALYYFNEPDPSIFESIVFPVLDDVSGVNGTHWVSEAVVANPNRWTIENYNFVQPVACIDYPCLERLQPGFYEAFHGDGYPHGATLLSPRGEAETLSFGLRVRDTSRVQAGFGSEVPVVREADMARDHALALLDVPRDPRYRVKVRVYAIKPYLYTGTFTQTLQSAVTIVDTATNARTTQSVTLTGGSVTQPAYAEFDLPSGNANQFSAVYIQPAGFQILTWAFATVTNNETQQVTVITPDGDGNVPCAPCAHP